MFHSSHLYIIIINSSNNLPFIVLRANQNTNEVVISDQIWRVGLNFNWKGIYSCSPSKMKGNINNCTSIDKYKLTKPFQQKNAKNKYCFSVLVVKACIYVMEGPKSIESLQLIACLSLIPIWLLNWNRIPKEVY